MSISLWHSPVDDNDTHLRITIYSGLESDEEITKRENYLFDLLEQHNMIDALDFVVIAQHWINV